MNDLGLHDIYTFVHVPFWQTTLFFWSMIFAALFIGAVISWFAYSYFFPAAPKTSWQRALEQLHEINKKGVVHSNHSKQFYNAITQILKTYLSERYGVQLMGKSDVEVMKELYTLSLPTERIADLEALFTNGVLIKFAPTKAAQEMIEADFSRAQTFIRSTIPEEPAKK